MNNHPPRYGKHPVCQPINAPQYRKASILLATTKKQTEQERGLVRPCPTGWKPVVRFHKFK
ncbi:hypothetical protein JW960_16335 [candidate division KSB1 bacterium]|nr:hypothetical protein [candidate division KSB1 bacterium]